MSSLWGDEFEVSAKPEKVKKIVEKASKPKTLKVEKKTVTKKNASIEEVIDNIKNEVYKTLGRYADDTVVIDNVTDLTHYIDKAIQNKVIAIDTETNNSLQPITCKIMGLCLYTPGEKNAYIPVNHVNRVTNELLPNQVTEEDIRVQLERINEAKTDIIMHNGKFDYEVLKCTCNVECVPMWDTMVASKILDENESAKLKDQYRIHIDSTQEKYDIEHLFEKMEYAIFDPALFALYAATDSFITYKLYVWQKEQFAKLGNEKLYWVFKNIEMPVVEVVANMELTGVEIDKEYGKRLSEKYHKKLDALDKKLEEELAKLHDKIEAWRLTEDAQFKPQSKKPNKDGKYTLQKSKSEQLADPPQVTSPTQLAILMYDVFDVGVIDKKSPRGTGEDILVAIEKKYPELKLCSLILEKRGLEKLIGTYIDKIPEYVCEKDNRLHCSYQQYGAGTGRFSCIREGTKISMPGGDKNIEDVKVGDDVYCYDDNNKLQLSKVKNVWYTGDRECVRLSWRSKYNSSLTGELVCTPDHFIKTAEGWKMAKDLKPEDSILYVHRRVSENSVALYGWHSQGNEEEHLWIKNVFYNKKSSSLNIHHIDHNRCNNSLDNLTIVTTKEHSAIHRSEVSKDYQWGNECTYSYDQLMSMCENVDWELTKINHDLASVKNWLESYHINYIQKYTESYSSRPWIVNGNKKYKNLHLPLSKSNLMYALELSNGDTETASGYFGVSIVEFENSCNKYELLTNHNVVSIEYLPDCYRVYDIEVEKYHNFIAGELCVHNCSSPNLQNIPSHNQEIRLLFKAAGSTPTQEEIADNSISVFSCYEFERDNGEWVEAKSLSVGDKVSVVDDVLGEIFAEIKNIVVDNSKYIIEF